MTIATATTDLFASVVTGLKAKIKPGIEPVVEPAATWARATRRAGMGPAGCTAAPGGLQIFGHPGDAGRDCRRVGRPPAYVVAFATELWHAASMAYAVTIQGPAGLRGSDMQFTCTSSSCSGVDPATQNYFKALQAQLNRYVAAFMAKSKNPSVLKQFKLSVDGKLGSETVNTYRFVADGLIRGGVALTIVPGAASKDQLARNADDISETLQAVADRAGLPPGDVSVPGAPSASSAGGFGPSTTVSSQSPLPPDLVSALRAGTFPASPASPGLPANISLPDGTIVQSAADVLSPEAANHAGPSATEWAIYGGIGVAAIALFAFTIKRRHG